MKFTSSASIVLKSGKGGDGIIAWRREDRVRFGGPAGGSGGDGGSIYIEADENLNSLFHLRHIKTVQAKNGENGKNKSQHGRSAEDVILKVPCGTTVTNAQSKELLVDLIFHGHRFLCCRGGKGGRGNVSFKSSILPAPYLYERGDPHNEIEIYLDLKSIADVGFLGKPNAGKSSLLSAISNAKPRVADFPFTTINPVLGSVSLGDRKLVFADIPGLIENASSGAGLGFDFLKHLSRCDILIHLVDITSENIQEDIETIEKELQLYSSEIFSKTRILAFNKIDLISQEKIKEIEKKFKHRDPVFISILEGKNLDKLLDRAFAGSRKEEPKSLEIPDYLEFFDSPDISEEVRIEKINGVWMVYHSTLQYWIYKIPRDTLDNISRLSQKIENFNLNQKLENLGAKKGDEFDVYGWRRKYLVD